MFHKIILGRPFEASLPPNAKSTGTATFLASTAKKKQLQTGDQCKKAKWTKYKV
jgi:hypothetical protein